MVNIQYVKGDALSFGEGILINQVNAQGKYASGIAKQIKEKYPIAYDVYINKYREQGNCLFLGQSISTMIDDNRLVSHLVAQENYGYGGHQYTSYSAIEISLQNLIKRYNLGFFDDSLKPIIHSPLIGCGLGGGDWNIVSEIISRVTPSNFEFFVWQFD